MQSSCHWLHAPTSRITRGSRITEHIVCVFLQKTCTLHRAMSYVTPHMMTPSTGTPSSHVLHPSLSEHTPCGDLRPHLSGALAEPRPCSGYEPKQLAENQDHWHFTEESSSLNTRIYVSNPCPSTNRSQRRNTIQRKASRHRSRNWTQTMSNFVLWLHHCIYRREKQVQNDRKLLTLNEKNGCPVHLKIR